MNFKALAFFVMGSLASQQAYSAIALDRTRVVFDGDQDSISLNVSNQNKTLPYLAQGWIEDDKGNKIQAPLTVLPPVQRIEPGKPSQIKIQALPVVRSLPQDRETLYYFNLREIPPKSNKPNSLQIALQTRIKLFYRPAAIKPERTLTPWQEQLTLIREGEYYKINNPTPYYITIINADNKKDGDGVKGFEPFMIEPKTSMQLTVGIASLGNAPVLTYINDYGGRPQITFSCTAAVCKVVSGK